MFMYIFAALNNYLHDYMSMTTFFLTIIDFKTLLFYSYRSCEHLVQRNVILSATPNLFSDSGVQHPPWRGDGKHTQSYY